MASKNIVIVDFMLGNIFSVQQAFVSIGESPILSNDRKTIANADALVLPGVGAFGDAMRNIRKLEIFDSIVDFVKSGKPFLGVCLGMQLLFEKSLEFGNHQGFGFIKGDIIKIPSVSPNGTKLRVPQISWNTIQEPKFNKWLNTPLEGIRQKEYMYFVHSYYANPSNKEDIIAETNYSGFEYCSAILKDNIFATQFHPEKSGIEGVKIYKKWVESF